MPAARRHRNPKAFYLRCKVCGEVRQVTKSGKYTKGWLHSHSPEKGTLCIKCAKAKGEAPLGWGGER